MIPAQRAGPLGQRPSVHPPFFLSFFSSECVCGVSRAHQRGVQLLTGWSLVKTYWHPAGGRSGGRKTPPSEDGAVGFPPSVFVWQLCVCVSVEF